MQNSQSSDVLSNLGLNDPAGHAVQTDWPVALLYVPGAHDWHEELLTLPGVGLYVPGAQERHEELPGVGLYVPGAQEGHEEPVDELYVPIGQELHEEPPHGDGLYGLYDPGRH